MKRRIISFILCLVMIAGLFPFSAFTLVHAATTSQTNIVARANYLYGLTWTCQQDVSGWRGNYTFTKGKTYRLPYGQPINTGEYIGHVVLVTGLTYSGSTLTKVEITEQTPPQLKRTTYTPEQLISKYSSAYTILRYNNYVPASPGGSGSGDSGSGDSGSSGGSGSSITTKYFPACASSYESIVSALNSIGVDSSKDYRTVITTFNGISNYTGTAAQNESMLKLLKAGQLLNPEYVADSDSSSTTRPPVYYPPVIPNTKAS